MRRFRAQSGSRIRIHTAKLNSPDADKFPTVTTKRWQFSTAVDRKFPKDFLDLTEVKWYSNGYLDGPAEESDDDVGTEPDDE